MPTITVTLFKDQLTNNFGAQIRALPNLGTMVPLEGDVMSKLNKSFPTNHVNSIKARELPEDNRIIEFVVIVQLDNVPPRTPQDIKEALMLRASRRQRGHGGRRPPCPRRRPQYVQHSAPSCFPQHAPRPQRRSIAEWRAATAA